jgi:hypothetical protein
VRTVFSSRQINVPKKYKAAQKQYTGDRGDAAQKSYSLQPTADGKAEHTAIMNKPPAWHAEKNQTAVSCKPLALKLQ